MSLPAERESSSPSPEAAAIAATTPFDDLPEAIVEPLAQTASVRSYAAGETIFAMGQYDGSEFLIVRSGRIKASQVDPKSGAMLFEDIPDGEMFGLAVAAAGADPARLSGFSLSADKDCIVVGVDSATLRDLARERPSLARALMLHFARKLCGEAGTTEEGSPERRVYAALSAYIVRDPLDAVWRIPKMPRHKELAERADVEEAHAANAVARLIQTGIARRDYPGLIIDAIDELNRLAR